MTPIDQRKKTLKAMRYALKETIRRCHHEGHPQYHYYGGRGIQVCQEWRDSFDTFVADMGLRPEGLTLERVDNDLGYCKSNCVWATRAEQSANRRANKFVTWEGLTLTVAEWERRKGFKPGTLKARLGATGYSLEVAFTKEVKCGGKSEVYAYRRRNPPNPDRIKRGQEHSKTALTKEIVQRIRETHDSGVSLTAIATALELSTTTVCNAYKGTRAYQDV